MTESASARFTAPPPPGTTCDCEPSCYCPDLNQTGPCDHILDHWHQRFMGASCDSCTDTEPIEADVFCYTRADAFAAIAGIARDAGWSVTDAGYYQCPACVARAGRVAKYLTP